MSVSKEDAKKLSTLGDELAKAEELEEATIKAKDEKEAVTAAITENEQKLRSINETITEEETHYNTIKTSTEAECPVDEEGRQATIEILGQLRQRFKKILVISHVEDVKDAFDTKLVISKTPSGMSVVEMT